MSYNSYQSMYYKSLYGQSQSSGKKEYALYENGVKGQTGEYPLLQYLKKQKIDAGTPAYLLKIKRVK